MGPRLLISIILIEYFLFIGGERVVKIQKIMITRLILSDPTSHSVESDQDLATGTGRSKARIIANKKAAFEAAFLLLCSHEQLHCSEYLYRYDGCQSMEIKIQKNQFCIMVARNDKSRLGRAALRQALLEAELARSDRPALTGRYNNMSWYSYMQLQWQSVSVHTSPYRSAKKSMYALF